jgi:16S rRNA (uracil1498-N3)-methyltransferase
MTLPPKKLHRFFLPAIPDAPVFDLTDLVLVHQLVTVLRYGIGKNFIVFTAGSDDNVVSITAISKRAISVTKAYTIPAQIRPPKNIIAAVSITKRDSFELVVQKLTELGVSTIVPLLAVRSVKQSVRIDRLKLISREALEQSGGNMPVDIREPLSLEACFETFPFPSVVFDPYTPETTDDIASYKTLVMYIGPEGGWSEEDQAVFEKYSPFSKRLGYTILRTETAAIVGAYELQKNS